MNNPNKNTTEVFDHHLQAFTAKNVDEIMVDFSDEAIYICSGGVIARGKTEIRKVYENYFKSQQPGTTSKITNKVIEGDIVFLEWISNSPSISINDGADTFVIRHGLIQPRLESSQKYTNNTPIDKGYYFRFKF